MKKLNIVNKSEEDGTYYKVMVIAHVVEWNTRLKLFYHKNDDIYYLTEYTSGSYITSAPSTTSLRKNLDKIVNRYGIQTIKKRIKKVIRVSKLIANK